ncbi:MAG: sensor histidine kinase [Actinomycetota bacterium]|nr:sensor histidine kinase [Actinomycetota bacterium]
MFPPSTYTASCRRDGADWLVHVPGLGRTVRTARLTQVEGAARALVAACSDEHSAACRVVVELDVRHGLSELLDAAAAARQDPDRVSVEAVTLRRGLARRLVAEGLDVRDVAALLGLSYGRALQLVGEGHAPRTTTRPLTLSPPPPPPRGEPDAGLADDRHPAPAAPPAVTPAAGQTDRTDVRPHRSYRHEAYLYRGRQGFLDTTAPFVAEGAALGQPVMVAVVPARLEPLRAALGARAEHVYWVDTAELGANPARIIPAWRQFVDDHGGEARPVRGVGEPVWAGRRPAELVEGQFHEALLNLAVEPDTPLWLRCAYDAQALPADVLDEAARSHPALVDGEDYLGSRSYGGADHASTVFSGALPEPDAGVEELAFDEETLDAVRRTVLARAEEAGLGHGRSADLALAVAEASSNSVRHGGGRGRLRVWQQDDALVCEITDSGEIADALAGRRTPSLTAEGGRGLWMVNQLGDLVQLRSRPGSSTVRVLSWL